MPDHTMGMPPLTSAQAVMEYLRPAPLDRIEVGPLYRPQEHAGTPEAPGEITHFARTAAKAVAITDSAYQELLHAKQQLKRNRKK